MGRENWTYTQESEKELMKEVYGDYQELRFNKNNILYSQIKKDYNFGGEVKKIALEGSIGGAVFASASGQLAKGSRNKTLKAELRRTKHYGRTELDRETMKVARGGKESFVNVTKHAVRVLTDSFARDMERKMILGDVNGSGLLAVIDGTPSGGTGGLAEVGTLTNPLVLPLAADTVMAQFEEGDILSLNEEGIASDFQSSILEVVNVVEEGTKAIHVIGAPNTPPADTNEIYRVLSKDAEFPGLQGILKATTGDYKTIPISRRWKAHQTNASAAAISTSLINGIVVKMERATGKSPELILAPFEQYKALLDLHEDQKIYNLPSKDKRFKSTVGFSGIQIMTAAGAIPCVPSRFVPASEIYVLTTSKISLHCAPGGFEWMDDDGTVFMRREDLDTYEGRYGGYCDFYVDPFFQGIITNLSVPTL